MITRTRSLALVAGLVLATGAPLAFAAPASAQGAGGHAATAAESAAASWRLAYTFSTNAKCAHTGREGIRKGRWSSWYCQPTHNMTRFELWVQ